MPESSFLNHGFTQKGCTDYHFRSEWWNTSTIQVKYFIGRGVFLYNSSPPESSCEDSDRDDDDGTHRTEGAEDSHDEFLRDHISIEAYSSECHDSEDLGFSDGFSYVSWEREENEDRVDDECNHRKGDLEFTDRENNSTRILEDATTRKCTREVTGHILQSSSIHPVPIFIRRNREVGGIEYSDTSEDEDDEVGAHRKKLWDIHYESWPTFHRISEKIIPSLTHSSAWRT